uniref:Uncharacterized protein n=1 Tax=Rhodnius prolixus TaxID=13249 RepID=T1HIJ8_RHOPR
MRVFYAIGLLVFINVQVNSSSEILDVDEKNFDDDEKSNKETEVILTDITGTKTLLEPSSAERFKLVRCYQQATEQLQELRKDSISDFYRCDRLNEYFSFEFNIDRILNNSVRQCTKLMNDLKAALGKCIGGDPLTEAYCITQAMSVFNDKIKRYELKNEAYAVEVQNIGKEVRELFQYCAHQDDQKLEEQLASILEQRKFCL